MSDPPGQTDPGDPWLLRHLAKRVQAALGKRRMDAVADAVLSPVGGILFIPTAWFGALLWLAIAPAVARVGAALLGLLVAGALSRILTPEDSDDPVDYLRANSVLASLAAAWILPPDVPVLPAIALIAVAALVAAVLTAALSRGLGATSLPPLVWGFCAVAGTLFMIFPDWTRTASAAIEWGPGPGGLLDWFTVFFRSLGSFLFAPKAWIGMLIVLGIILWSPPQLLAGTAGWIAGVVVANILTGLGVVFDWQPVSYNFFLAGMTLGAVYYLPGWPGIGIAVVAGTIASFGAVALEHLWHFSPVAYLPTAFLATTWIGILVLQRSHLGRGRMNTERHLPPHRAWLRAEIETARWGRNEPLLIVPLYGAAHVTQGFDGALSHAGRWRHALDFQRPSEAAGMAPRPIFGDAVLAPAPGVVVAVENTIPDNPAGISNFAENWGNHVVIALDPGGWVTLAHLCQGSVTVGQGARVGFGTIVGAVGNSGRSPVPHLHLQAQTGPHPGAPTRPFRLANYLFSDAPDGPLLTWRASGAPAEGTRLAAALSNPSAHGVLAGMAPGTGHWSLNVDGQVPAPWLHRCGSTNQRVDVTLDTAGRQIFSAPGAGTIVARFDPDAWRIAEVDDAAPGLLKLLALALPSAPYCLATGIRWMDIAPFSARSGQSPPARMLSPFLAPPLCRVNSSCRDLDSGTEPSITIETVPAAPWPGLPKRLTAVIRPLRGPVSIVSEFETGTLTCEQYSFTPRMPLHANA